MCVTYDWQAFKKGLQLLHYSCLIIAFMFILYRSGPAQIGSGGAIVPPIFAKNKCETFSLYDFLLLMSTHTFEPSAGNAVKKLCNENGVII